MGKLKIRVVAWNVNFAGRSRAVIAKQLVGLGRYHIYGLTKISPGDTAFYLKNIQSLGNGYNSIVRATGGDDRMMVYDSFRLEVLEKTELKANGGVRTNDVNFPDRSPLMVRFKDKANDIEFTVVLSDFAGGSADLRWEQARALRLWATGQTVPIIALGDYSFDYDFSARRSDDAAFFELVAGKTWFWVKPRFDQIWSDRNGDGVYDNPASCDFTFVNVEARSWSPRSRVLVGSPDDVRTSDHLPVELVVRPR